MPPSCSVSTPRWSRRFRNLSVGGAFMKALAVVIGIVFAAAVAALAVALAFPNRFADYLPEILQPSVEGGPQLVLGVELDRFDALSDLFKVMERRLKDLGVRFAAQ